MCFTIIDGKIRPKKAKKDIICYKALNPDYTPYFAINHRVYFTYKKDELLPKIELKPYQHLHYSKPNEYVIDEGYHSHWSYNWIYENVLTPIERKNYNYLIKQFKIPKGAKYFEGIDGYVSETIIMVED